MAEDALLNADYAVVNFGVFWGAGEVESASLFLQMVIELGRRIKCIGREDVFGKRVHRAFLVGESNWREWPGCAGLADDCAVNVNAADITGEDGCGIAMLCRENEVGRSQFVIGVAGRVVFCEDFVFYVVYQFNPAVAWAMASLLRS